MYQFAGRVRYSETNSDRRLTLSALTDYFQDCCTFQSEDIGVGNSFLDEKGGAWILSSWEIVIHRLPEVSDKIVTGTWPCGFKGFYGERNFILSDEAGEILAFANSLWVYMDKGTLKPARIPEKLIEAYEDKVEKQMDYPWMGRKIHIEGEAQEQQPVMVHQFFIDSNHHMNNGKYIMVAEEYLPEDFCVERIRVEYRKAAVLGDVLYPMLYVQEDGMTVVLADEEKKPYAVVQFIKAAR